MNNNITIHKVKNFEKHKQNLIDLIFSVPQSGIRDGLVEKISHSDWNHSKERHRKYFDYMLEHIIPDFSKFICNTYGVDKLRFGNAWFQVYEPGDYHSHHTHPRANMANVLFIELPDKNLSTSIKGQNKENISIDISEGDILSFPAFLVHSSRINKSNKRKIVIAFNTDLLKV